MIIPTDFKYIKPKTLDEAVKILAEYKEKARILAGGTDLINMMKEGVEIPEIVIDIKGIPCLSKLELKNDEIFIGATITINDLINSKLIKDKLFILREASGKFASGGVRNRATVVGNICSAVPCLDTAAPLLVHEAKIHLLSTAGDKIIPINKWFVNVRKTAIGDNEIVTGISIPLSKKKYAGSYNKMMRYSGEDLAQANVGILSFEDNTFRVAFGSVGPIPKRAYEIENLLNKKGVSDKVIDEAKNLIDTETTPITDIRATKEYRFHMTKVMFERGLKTAIKRLVLC
ncbi:MAG: xanthine dehydrogenase family protein subunit M [Bacteroidales bacterium]|nr:xanthine dehydrogenase family protein subunit M [Bacteroidales bacterium]